MVFFVGYIQALRHIKRFKRFIETLSQKFVHVLAHPSAYHHFLTSLIEFPSAFSQGQIVCDGGSSLRPIVAEISQLLIPV